MLVQINYSTPAHEDFNYRSSIKIIIFPYISPSVINSIKMYVCLIDKVTNFGLRVRTLDISESAYILFGQLRQKMS